MPTFCWLLSRPWLGAKSYRQRVSNRVPRASSPRTGASRRRVGNRVPRVSSPRTCTGPARALDVVQGRGAAQRSRGSRVGQARVVGARRCRVARCVARQREGRELVITLLSWTLLCPPRRRRALRDPRRRVNELHARRQRRCYAVINQRRGRSCRHEARSPVSSGASNDDQARSPPRVEHATRSIIAHTCRRCDAAPEDGGRTRQRGCTGRRRRSRPHGSRRRARAGDAATPPRRRRDAAAKPVSLRPVASESPRTHRSAPKPRRGAAPSRRAACASPQPPGPS